MRFNLLSSFAAGVLLTTSICSIAYFSNSNHTTKASVKTQKKIVKVMLTDSEMKNKLASDGYMVQTKAEYDQNLNAAKATIQNATDNQNNNSKKIVYRAVIGVSNGMTSIDVGNMLKKAKIIKDAFKFSKDIEKRKLENNLRPGTFVVDSSMSYDQVISTIFKK